MISLVVNLALTYFALKFVLWLYGLLKDKDDSQLLIINKSDEKIDPKPLNLPPDPKINLSLDNINNIKDTNFKNLLVKSKSKRKNHITVSVNYV
jgi:hypothetical protein